MEIDLSLDEVEILRECLNYSKLNLREGAAPDDIKRRKLEQLDALQKKFSTVIHQPPLKRDS
ncbi:hypothetical protein [Rhizobacter sp. OV335]|uniref:hypothetical protein n=1 Tax=Rhizobacter sp. OV335 TaxID=1500264 RepID=UPI000920B7F7|nr:hypothetical protein [Rhizobacter sp. OV335]SHN33863.1 hypothetical protein SAMN02787076_05294 [Rhizobacter sp. OV335]